jgi:hypothetical protein
MNPASRSLYKTRRAFGEMWDRETVCSDLEMMRGTAVGATGDALVEFNEALSAGAIFEGRDYSATFFRFSRRIINLSADGAVPQWRRAWIGTSGNRIKWLAQGFAAATTP